MLTAFVCYRFIYESIDTTRAVFDAYQEFTFEINRKLYHGWDNVVIGIGQVMMDGWILSSALFW